MVSETFARDAWDVSRLRVPDLRPSVLRRRTLRLVLSRRQNLMPDITTLHRLPASSTFPVRRHGIDPVPQLGETRDREPVTRLTSLMGVDIWLVTGFDEAREVLADLTATATTCAACSATGRAPRPKASVGSG